MFTMFGLKSVFFVTFTVVFYEFVIAMTFVVADLPVLKIVP